MTTLRGRVAAATVPTVLVSLPIFLVGALGVHLRRDLGFDEAALGFAVGVIPATGSLFALVAGRVIHRVGPGAGLRAGAVAAAVSMLGVAALARDFAALTMWLAVCGVGVALVYPASDSWIAGQVPRERQGIAMGVKQAAPPAAALLAGLAVPVLAVTVGWRWAFVVGGVATAVTAVLLPRGARRHERAAPPGPAGQVAWRPLAVLAAAFAVGQVAVLSLAGFAVSAMVEAGISASAAGLLAAAGGVTGIAVRLRLGHLADARPRNEFDVAAVMIVGGAACFLLLATGSAPLMVAVVPVAFATAWGWPGIFLLAVMRANPSAPAVASGIVQTGANVGAFLGPLLFGVLATRSYALAWTVAAGSGVVAAVAIAGAGRLVLASAEFAGNHVAPAAVPTQGGE